MRKENIIVAFLSEKITGSIVRMLSVSGFSSITVCQSGAEVKNQAMTFGSGIIICGYKLSDTTVINLAEAVPEEFSIILIGSRSQIELCEDDRVFKLSVPLRREELIETVSMLMSMHLRYGVSFDKSPTEEEKKKEIIEDAKMVLITRYSMTEEQAHRYIQKKSMDTGTKMVDIARLIID